MTKMPIQKQKKTETKTITNDFLFQKFIMFFIQYVRTNSEVGIYIVCFLHLNILIFVFIRLFFRLR